MSVSFVLLSTALGVHCKDGVILATEKLISSPMLVPSSGRQVHRVASHVAVVSV